MGDLASKKTFAGLFFQALATFLFTFLLYRLFSVSMWYHFAFMALAIAMFGLVAGSIFVYLYAQGFAPEQCKRQLAFHATWLAITCITSFIIFLQIPVWPQVEPIGLLSICLVYVVFAVPFYFSGICTCLSLTKFPQQISKLYACLLTGLASGALLSIFIFNFIDCLTAFICVAFLQAVGALCFALDSNSIWLKKVAFTFCLVFSSWSIAHAALVYNGTPILHLTWIKGFPAPEFLYEKWNVDSFVAVSELGNCWPMGFGLAPRCTNALKINQNLLSVDCDASAPLTAYDGNLQKVNFLQCDVTNACHYLRRNADVFIIGVGGGRDILSALAFKQKSVLAVADNACLYHLLKDKFKGFTGGLADYANVSLALAEPRRYIASSNGKFDIIQSSLGDNLIASQEDVFCDNSAYTVNAWKVFFAHLKDDGLLSVSCWYRIKDTPAEMYKLTNLAATTLKMLGCGNPRQHIVILANLKPGFPGSASGVGTIIVSKQPLSDDDIGACRILARQLGFAIVLSPKTARNPIFSNLADGNDKNHLVANLPLNVAAPTDDRPFFFNVLRFADVGFKDLWLQEVSFNVDRKAAFVLYNLLFTTIVLTLISTIGPFMLTQERQAKAARIPLLCLFAFIAFGFPLICLSQIEHLQIFLGYGDKGKLILLFILLASSALGSYFTGVVADDILLKTAQRRLWFLVAILICGGIFSLCYVLDFQFVALPARIAISCLALVPIGFFIGMSFPLAMRNALASELAAWLLAVSKAGLICGSVLACVIVLYFGITACYIVGVLFYVCAVMAFFFAGKTNL